MRRESLQLKKISNKIVQSNAFKQKSSASSLIYNLKVDPKSRSKAFERSDRASMLIKSFKEGSLYFKTSKNKKDLKSSKKSFSAQSKRWSEQIRSPKKIIGNYR